MLERVALGQTRFSVPGVSIDGRGIVLGRLGVLLFPSLDGVAAWLRLYSDEESLDDLLPSMKILRVRTPLGARGLAMTFPSSSSYVLDRAARCARLAGGLTFTGTSKHFVRYRDERAPQGYDVVDLAAVPPNAELVLHGEEASQPYLREGEIDVGALILRLSLRRVPGSEKLDAAARAELYIAAPRGLGHGLVRYLLRSRTRAEVALVVSQKRSAFAADGDAQGYLLARAYDVPERVIGSLRGVPGLGLFQGVCENVAVEVGWRHPVTLSSCPSLFAGERFHLFWGEGRGGAPLHVIDGPVVFSRAEQLTELLLPGADEPGEVRKQIVPAEPLSTEVRLVPTLVPPRRVVGTLVALGELAWLKRLVYTMPPSMLAAHRVAVTDAGALLLCKEAETIVPLGTALCELAPGLLVPLGMDLVPRVSVEVLQAALLRHARAGAQPPRGDLVTVFPPSGAPFFVPAHDLVPLERRVLARVPVDAAPAHDLGNAPPAEDPTVTNQPVGRFSLWGFRR